MSLEVCTHTGEMVRVQITAESGTEAREGFHCRACDVVYLGVALVPRVPRLTPLGRMFAEMMTDPNYIPDLEGRD